VQQSKLGRTPITVPPGVELQVSDLYVKKDMTSYKKEYKRRITVKGPLGERTWLGRTGLLKERLEVR